MRVTIMLCQMTIIHLKVTIKNLPASGTSTIWEKVTIIFYQLKIKLLEVTIKKESEDYLHLIEEYMKPGDD